MHVVQSRVMPPLGVSHSLPLRLASCDDHGKQGPMVTGAYRCTADIGVANAVHAPAG